MGYDMYAKGNSNTEDNYFRLNVWGMGDAREQLYGIGIVREAAAPPCPQLSEYANELDHEMALQRWVCAPAGDGPGIPAYKLGSNDGWVVLPVEVRSGVLWADAHHPGWRDRLHDYVAEFVVWMESCDEGFEVW